MSKEETSGDAGVEILKNHSFSDSIRGNGQYTYKVYHLGSKVPRFVRMMAPKTALQLCEEAWNAYPRCETGKPR
jgi:alpha-mannosidase